MIVSFETSPLDVKAINWESVKVVSDEETKSLITKDMSVQSYLEFVTILIESGYLKSESVILSNGAIRHCFEKRAFRIESLKNLSRTTRWAK